MSQPGTVVKLGGSLFDHPQLFPALNRWLARVARPVLLVPGGGGVADVVREWHRIHELKDVVAHDIALASLNASFQFVLKMIPGSVGSDGLSLREEPIQVIHLQHFGSQSELPKSWAVTTDSLAAEIAVRHQLDLILLKSVTIPNHFTWDMASSSGYVDEWFPKIVEQLKRPAVAINFRAWMSMS